MARANYAFILYIDIYIVPIVGRRGPLALVPAQSVPNVTAQLSNACTELPNSCNKNDINF